MAGFSFQQALSTPGDQIERAPNAPAGHYVWTVPKVPQIREQSSDKGSWDVIDIPLQAVEARDDVDPDELAAFGSLKKLTNRLSFMFDKNDEVAANVTFDRLRDFIEKHAQVEFGSLPLKQALNNLVNCRFIAQLVMSPDKANPEIIRANVRNTAPVE